MNPKSLLNLRSFNNMPKEEADAIRAKSLTVNASKKQSISQRKRYFRQKNPDIDALMRYYKKGDEISAMEKYVYDNQRILSLYEEAETVSEKNTILSNYMKFQLDIHKLMFGTKSMNTNTHKIESIKVTINRPKKFSKYGKPIKDDIVPEMGNCNKDDMGIKPKKDDTNVIPSVEEDKVYL